MFDPDEKTILCAKGKIYQTIESSEFEYDNGLIFFTTSEISVKIPLTLKIFEKYFTTIDEMRNIKINDILDGN